MSEATTQVTPINARAAASMSAMHQEKPAKRILYGHTEKDVVRACKRAGMDVAATVAIVDRLRDPHNPNLDTPLDEKYQPPETKRPYSKMLAYEIGSVCGRDVQFSFLKIYDDAKIHTNKTSDLVNCFQFDQTPQGLEYWKKINQQLRTARGPSLA